MSLYGPVRTANDSGRSSVEADWIRTGGASSVAIGKHELSFDAFATELGGRTTLQNKESVLSSSGALAFSGVLNDVFGGTINAGGNLVFDGIANLSGTSISAGGPVYINTISSLSNVMLGSAGVNIAGGGAFIGSGKILGAVNSSGKIIPSDPLVIIGSLVSNSGATINLTGSTLNVFGAVTDNGTTTGTIGGCPNCIGLQPALYTIQNGYTLGESGSLALGGVMQIGGSFDSFLTDSSRFQMLGGTIRFAAAGSSSFEAMSHDFGPAGAAMRGTVDGSFPQEIGPYLPDLLDLSRADITSRKPGRRQQGLTNIDTLSSRIGHIVAEDAVIPPLPSGIGDAIMVKFQMPPSRLIGDLKRELLAKIDAGEIEARMESDYYLPFVEQMLAARAEPPRLCCE